MIEYCWGCKGWHESPGWKGKTIETEGGEKFVWLCDKWFKSSPVEFLYNPKKKARVEAQREKHAADLEQPFMSNKPNPKFIEVHKNDSEMLGNYFTKKELRDSGV